MLPEILYRLCHPEIQFRDGFLVTNAGSGPMHGFMIYRKVTRNDRTTVPMVHPEEWRNVARTLFWAMYQGNQIDRFALLHLYLGLVQDLQVKPHDLLPHHGEYFGRVPREAIKFQQDYTWIRTGKPIGDIEKELLERNRGLFQDSEGWDLKVVKSLSECRFYNSDFDLVKYLG